MNRIRPEDFQDLDESESSSGMLGYLDSLSELEAAQAIKARSFALLELASGSILLDVGCGTGDDARAMAARVGERGRVVGVDSSEAAINEANRRCANSDTPVEFLLGDASNLRFSAGEFDGTRADRLLQHVEDPEQALHEMVRVTRPGGKVVVFDADWGTLVVDSPDRKVTEHVIGSMVESVRNSWVGRQLRAMFLDAGLEEVVIRPEGAILTSFQVANQIFWLSVCADRAVERGELTAVQAASWLDQLRRADESGRFFAGLGGYLVAGRKPGG